jgi:hypothetical protein
MTGDRMTYEPDGIEIEDDDLPLDDEDDDPPAGLDELRDAH